MDKLERYILERDPEALREVKKLFDANYDSRNTALGKGIRYGVKRTLDHLGISVIGINE